MMRPFLDLAAAYRNQKTGIDDAISEVLASGRYVLGEKLEKFEKEWARYCGAKYCIGVGSGLDALSLTLMGLGIGPGDEVVVPSFTFVATWMAVSQVGATPVPVDCDLSTFNIDANLIEPAITTRTRAIVPVHLYGQPADLINIIALAKNYGLHVIEDAAQAHGAELGGIKIGGHGNPTCWSFYPGKNLGAIGDGGAVTTDSEDLKKSLQKLRNYGSTEKYRHETLGRNSRLDDLQAAVLSIKLEQLDDANSKRELIAQMYSKALELKLGENSALLSIPSADHKSAWHQYVIRALNRQQLQQYLESRNIPNLVHYPVPPHQQKIFSTNNYSMNQVRIAERVSREVLSLPIDPYACSELIEATVEALGEFYS